MTTITLPPDIEGPLREEARKQGKTLEEVVIERLRKALPTEEKTIPEAATERTLFDRLAGHIGIVEGTGEAWSENCDEKFTDGLVEKQKEGKL